MKAGKYYIGDLSYVMTDAEWDECCDITIKDNEYLSGVFKMNDGREFASYATLRGNGRYPAREVSLKGYSYVSLGNCPVDTGLIGCILVDDIQKVEGLDGGVVVEFDSVFTPFEDDGVIHFGRVYVNTRDDSDSDDDDSEAD